MAENEFTNTVYIFAAVAHEVELRRPGSAQNDGYVIQPITSRPEKNLRCCK